MTFSLEHRVAIRVRGLPIPQGSKVANRFGRGVRDANATRLKVWRGQVAAAAADAVRYEDDVPFTGPVKAWLRFTFIRPASHYRSGRNAHLLRDSAPLFPGHGCGDIDKLQRAIFDALTDADVWADDTQVVDVRARKMYAGEDELALDRAGVDIIIEPLTEFRMLTPVDIRRGMGFPADYPSGAGA